MASNREPPTLADYAVTAVSPVLIMLMVGSLVFFLVEVLYAGQYSDRLLYSMFFFVIGIVLVARISIQVDPGRAAMFEDIEKNQEAYANHGEIAASSAVKKMLKTEGRRLLDMRLS